MVLGKLLAEQGNTFLTHSWLYATEIRIFSLNIPCSVFFRFTDDWHVVRALANIFSMVVFLACYFYFLHQLNLKKYFLITAALLLVPINNSYYMNVYNWGYYISYLCFLFLSLGLVFQYIKTPKSIVTNLLLVIIPALSCLEGVRCFVFIFIPLLLTAGVYSLKSSFQESKQVIIPAVIAFIASGSGLLVNCLYYSRLFRFLRYDKALYWIDLSDDLNNNLMNLLRSYFEGYGYVSDSVSSLASLQNIFFIFVLILTVSSSYKILKQDKYDKNSLIFLFYFISFSFYTIVALFSHMDICPRYIYLTSILAIPVFLFIMQNYKQAAKVFICICILLIIFGRVISLEQFKTHEEVIEQKEIMNVLLDEGYYDCYASFWHSHILTELSNGKINTITFNFEKQDDIDFKREILRDIQKLSNVDNKPTGKICFLISKDNYDNNPILNSNLDENTALYQTKNYIVFGFDSLDSAIKKLGPKATYSQKY